MGDDIPLARRSKPALPRSPSYRQRLGWIGLGAIIMIGPGLVVLSGPLARWLAPRPVAGLDARLGEDGRLLGHFPYPQAKRSQLVDFYPGVRLRADAGQALLSMQADAAAAGIDISILSTFRSAELQRELFFEVMSLRNQSAKERAKVSAPPGFSEHSTGFAVDLGDSTAPQTNLSTNFEQTPAYKWLTDNAAKYHFKLSFPKNNAQGVSHEPWHWRYEGSTEALKLFEPAQRLQS